MSEEKEDEMGKKMEEGLEMSGTIIMIYARYMMLGLKRRKAKKWEVI